MKNYLISQHKQISHRMKQYIFNGAWIFDEPDESDVTFKGIYGFSLQDIHQHHLVDDEKQVSIKHTDPINIIITYIKKIVH